MILSVICFAVVKRKDLMQMIDLKTQEYMKPLLESSTVFVAQRALLFLSMYCDSLFLTFHQTEQAEMREFLLQKLILILGD